MLLGCVCWLVVTFGDPLGVRMVVQSSVAICEICVCCCHVHLHLFKKKKFILTCFSSLFQGSPGGALHSNKVAIHLNCFKDL